MRAVRSEFVRFLASGAINTALSYAVYFVLLPFVHYLVAYGIAYAFGIVLSYWLMSTFVFEGGPRWGTAARFPLVYVAQFLLGSATTSLLVEAFGVSPAVAAAVAIVLVVPVTFVVARWIFRRAGLVERRRADPTL